MQHTHNSQTCLAAAVLGGTTPFGRTEVDSSNHHWSDVVGLAARWRVLPQLSRNLIELGIEVPGAAQAELHRRYVRAVALAAMFSNTARDVQQALVEHDVASAAIKGVAVMHTAYASPLHRSVGDIDLLVDGHDREAVRRALNSLEFEERTDNKSAPSRFFLSNDSSVFERNGMELDVHYQLVDTTKHGLATLRLLERAVTVPIEGGHIKATSPTDSVMILSHHVLRNRFDPASTLKDLSDLNAFVATMGTEAVPEWIDQARSADLVGTLGGMLWILADYGRPPNKKAWRIAEDRLTPSERAEGTGLAELFGQQLRHGRLSPVLLATVAGDRDALRERLASSWRFTRDTITKSTSNEARANGARPNPVPGGVRAIRHLANPQTLRRYRALNRARRPFRAR